jgi:hypothetical protein
MIGWEGIMPEVVPVVPEAAKDFESIGKGSVFTGSLDGDNNKYTIYGLTDSLFETVAGQVSKLSLSGIDYRRYPAGGGAFTGMAKPLWEDEDVTFGAVAKVLREGGKIAGVDASGNITVHTSGLAKAKIGGLAGASYGGEIISCITYINFDIRALQADVGGIVGAIEGKTRVDDSSLGVRIGAGVTLGKIESKGSIVHAGLVAGIVYVPALIGNVKSSNAAVIVNGAQTPASQANFGLYLPPA